MEIVESKHGLLSKQLQQQDGGKFVQKNNSLQLSVAIKNIHQTNVTFEGL